MSFDADVIVVGGGTAGCIVASRLSADEGRSVLLLEAGSDYFASPDALPYELLEGRYNPMRGQSPEPDPSHDWGLVVKSRSGDRIAAAQARVIGGGSSVNAMMSIRGVEADHREWVAEGNDEWGWDEALSAYIALEDDAAPGAFHGKGGPWSISRHHWQQYGPLQKAFVESCLVQGFAEAWDLNQPGAAGVGPIPMSRFGSRRMSTAIAYLNPARLRPNLEVRGDALVDRILLDGSRAQGVVLADGSVITAKTVVLAAGALLSPAILQRSGIGPRDALESVGIECVVDLPVGDNLFDHASVPLLAVPREGVWSTDQFSMQTGARFSTSIQPDSFDAQLTMFSYLNARTTGDARGLAGDGSAGLENVAGVSAMLHKPRATGTVRVTSADPRVLPDVDPNYLGHPTDVLVMREIVRRGWSVLRSQPLRVLLGEPLSLTDEIVADDDALDRAIESMVAAVYHFNGSCKMASPERAGVVDQSGEVYGTEGVRVADASVVPTSPASNMMLPTIMTAERLSARARAQL